MHIYLYGLSKTGYKRSVALDAKLTKVYIFLMSFYIVSDPITSAAAWHLLFAHLR